MKYRNLMISSLRKLSVENNQLVIDGEYETSIPLEDINSIVIENQRILLSAYLISAFSKNGIIVFVCDEKHLPTTVLLPFVTHSRHLQMIKRQIALTKPFKKQIWQQIVTAKIRNQAKCLTLLEKSGAEVLYSMSKEVKSGDNTHVEAKAAAYYFKCLYGNDFSRKMENHINAALNYGYAIIKAMIARTIVAYGFEPSLGIWHDSSLNSFNLADDLIEPFRPLVDLFVAKNIRQDDGELSTDEKKQIYNIINHNMQMNGRRFIVRNCIEMAVESLSTPIHENICEIELPFLVALELHKYE